MRFERVLSHIVAIDESAIKDTIFKRSPLFFSLILVLDSKTRLPSLSKFEDALFAIDGKFNSDTPANERSKIEADFHSACTASTQRIKSRRIRDKYLKKYL